MVTTRTGGGRRGSGVAARQVLRVLALGLAAALSARAAAVPRLPRVMLLIDERNLGSVPTAEVEALTGERMLGAGLPMVDQDMVRSALKRDRELMKLAGEARGAAVIGLQYGADVLVSGEAVAKPSARRIAQSNLRTYEATVTLRAVRTDNGATLATLTRTASVIGLDDTSGGSRALQQAAGEALDAFVPRLLDAWGKGSTSTPAARRLLIKASGVDQVWKLSAVSAALEGMTDGLRDVQMQSYMAGLAIFDAEALAAGRELAEHLVLKPPERLRVQVLNVDEGEFHFRVVPAGE